MVYYTLFWFFWNLREQMATTTLLVLAVIFLTLVYDMTNGWNDAANSIATVVSTKVLRPYQAVAMGATLDFIGALVSSEVARTVGKDIAAPHTLTVVTFLAAVIIAPIWITLCTYQGLPISCSHSLLGGLVGAVLATSGVKGLKIEGIKKIAFGVFISPILGFILGFIVVAIIYWFFKRLSLAKVNKIFGKLQLVSAAAMAFSHGTGDAQKGMGIITGTLLTAGWISLDAEGQMHIPLWVRILCALTIAMGTAVGGWRVVKTLGSKLAHLKPYQGFAAETAASITILMNTLSGVPLSTTHSITGAVMGVGSSQGIRIVKWGIGGKIVFAWFVTFPVCIGGGYLIYKLLDIIF